MSDMPPDYSFDEREPVQNTMADLSGQLKGWLGNIGDRISGWAQDAATLVNDFITRRDIADTAEAQAARYTENVREFSRGLDEVVRADPTATNMALGLAALTVPALVAEHPHLPDDRRGQIADALAGEIGKSIAQNSVVAWAQRDADTAHTELKRLGGLFTDQERGALADHVDLLGDARQMDAEAAQIAEVNARAEESHRRTLLYGDELLRPDGALVNPNWARRVVNDQNVSPDDTARLLDLQRMQQRANQLATSGTVAPITNGNKLPDFIGMAKSGMAGQKQLYDQAIAGNISLQDARTLIQAGRNPSDLAAIENFVNNARKAVKGPDGDLDPDGTAMAKLAHDVLTAYRTMGIGSLDPSDPNFFGAMRKSFGQNALDQRIAVEQKAQRLEDIFARRQASARAEVQRQAEMFGLRDQIGEVRREEALAIRNAARENAAEERAKRLELRDLDRQQRAEFAAAATRARFEAAQAPHAREPLPRGGGGGRSVQLPSPTETFRRFGRLGRPERV